ncbi:MAG: hypothetical protein AB7I48_03535 [Planctomycetaceae bacterium]
MCWTCFAACGASSDAVSPVDKARDEYLQNLVRSEDDVARFVERSWDAGVLSRNLGWTYDRELGWTLVDSVREDGVDKSRTYYHYEPDGARASIHSRDKVCRIHCYGDSFTHCDQVSDGETWEEYLAAHLQEPLRNYGVGGYSVYQAYLRMRKVEAVVPAPYIIFNIYDDDHYRNLDVWRSIRVGAKGPVGYPLPHLRVNVGRGEVVEVPNPAQRPEDLYRLTDFDAVRRTYADDPILRVSLVTRGKVEPTDELVAQVAASFGLSPDAVRADNLGDRIQKLHAEAALFASRRIMERVEEFCRESDRKLLVVLSHGRNGMGDTLSGKPRWDRAFLDFLATRDYPWVDLRDAHAADFAQFQGDVPAYIRRYYIGHYNPAGNFFCATALKDEVVNWLNPKPLPYRVGQ